MLPLTIAPEAIFINVISLAAVVVSLPEVTTTLVKGELPPSTEAYLATLVAKFDDVYETVISVAYVSFSLLSKQAKNNNEVKLFFSLFVIPAL